jgi:hypothetical protein
MKNYRGKTSGPGLDSVARATNDHNGKKKKALTKLQPDKYKANQQKRLKKNIADSQTIENKTAKP